MSSRTQSKSYPSEVIPTLRSRHTQIKSVRHFGFSKVGNFNFWSRPEAQYASACQISRRSVEPFRRYGRFSICQDAILDLFYACWDHPRRVFGGVYDCAKFGCNRCSNFNSMQISIFCTLSLKMPIHAPKIGVLGDFTSKMGSSMNETPKRHILGRKHVVWRIDRQNRSTCAGSAREE